MTHERTPCRKEEEQYLTFRIGEEWFGLAVTSIKDVMYTPQLTPVPLSSFEVAGLLNLRGYIVTAIHASLFLGTKAPPRTMGSMCIVLQDEKEDELYSFIVDKVYDIESWPKSLYGSLPLNMIPRWESVADGVFRLEGRVVTILNKRKMLTKLSQM